MEHVSNQDNLFIGKGRRKRAIARISLLPKPLESSESTYSCQINGQPLQSYFGNDPFSLLTVEGPLKLLAEINSLSDVNLDAPYKFTGAAALSVLNATTFFTFDMPFIVICSNFC